MRLTDNIKCCIALQHKIKNKGIQVEHDSLLIKQSSLCGVMHDIKALWTCVCHWQGR